MKFKNLSCDDAREMGAKVRELADIFCRKCDKHSELTETIKRQMEVIKQKDTEIDILIRKKEALQDKVEELQGVIASIYKQLKELEFLVEMMEVNENA